MKKFFQKSLNVLERLASSRLVMFAVVLLVGTVSVFAQDITAGTDALDQVTKGIADYIPFISKLIYVIAACVAIVGGISVYMSMQNDDQDVKKKIMMLVGSCIFLIAAATALPQFFGYNKSTSMIDNSNVIEYQDAIPTTIIIIDFAA